MKSPGIPGKIDDEGLTFDIPYGHKAPKTAIVTLVTIVPHHEEMTWGDFYRAKVVPRTYLSGKNVGISVDDVGLIKGKTVYKDFLVVDLYHVSGKAYHPFYEVKLSVFGKDEDDHVFSFGGFALDPKLPGDGIPHPVNELVDQDVIPHKEGRDHGAGGDFKGLDEKSADEKGKDQRQDYGLDPI